VAQGGLLRLRIPHKAFRAAFLRKHVFGHSGATGYNSDPANPGTDARANSWASGTNPDVQSIYSRLLAVDPGIEGEVTDAAVDGSHVYDLEGQLVVRRTELRRVPEDPDRDDLAPDHSHLSIAGLRKQATTEWELITSLL